MQDHYFTMRFHTSSLAFSILAVMATNTFAQSEQQEDTASSTSTQVLPKIKVQAEKQEKNSYAAKTATAVLRSNAPLFETAQSISVVTNQQIEQKQAKTICKDAIKKYCDLKMEKYRTYKLGQIDSLKITGDTIQIL
jgi:outer membrane receptor for ferric coprogen and ferric-rhodotorulic acid